MATRLTGFISSIVLALTASVAGAETGSQDRGAGAGEGVKQALDPAKSGIRNGCVANINIRRVTFDSRTTGVIELTGDRKVKITLRNPCSGIRTEGYVHKPINNNFCEGDILRVLNFGNSCVVDKLEPYVEETEEPEQGGENAAAGNSSANKKPE
ncbi:MAG: hypothetical protein M0Q95_15595 [Porticoccaceae bacterium]|nr:hypothetical protein [Porticoccaceae bacterium]